MPSPCFDCGEAVRSGPPSPVYQPSPPPQAQTREVCVLLPDETTQKGFLTQFWVQVPSSDCPSNVCMQPCGNSILTDLAGNDLAGQVIDCDVAETTPPQVPGVEIVCTDAAGTWTSPPCATQIRINVTQADATGPVLTIGAQTQILQVGLYEWNAPAGAVIDSMTLTNDTVNQCSEITWLQSGTVATPEAWVISNGDVGTLTSPSGADTHGRYNTVTLFGGNLYWATPDGVKRYDATLMSWTTPLAGDCNYITISEDNLTLYATIMANEVHSSTDGTTWNLHSTITGETRIGPVVDVGGTLFSCSIGYSAGPPSDPSTGRVYEWNGASWDQIQAGSGIGSNQINSLISYNGDLYVGYYANTGDTPIAIYDIGPDTWSTTTTGAPAGNEVNYLWVFDGDIYANTWDINNNNGYLYRRTGVGAWTLLESYIGTGQVNIVQHVFIDGGNAYATKYRGGTADDKTYIWDEGTTAFIEHISLGTGQTKAMGVGLVGGLTFAMGGALNSTMTIKYYQAAQAGQCT